MYKIHADLILARVPKCFLSFVSVFKLSCWLHWQSEVGHNHITHQINMKCIQGMRSRNNSVVKISPMPSGTAREQRGSLTAATQQMLLFFFFAVWHRLWRESALSLQNLAGSEPALWKRGFFFSIVLQILWRRESCFRWNKAVWEKCDAVTRANVLF